MSGCEAVEGAQSILRKGVDGFDRSTPVDGGALSSFRGNDKSDQYRKSRFLLAGLMGRMRIPWTRYIEVMGIGPLRDATELSFSDYALVIQGAIKGQGVALGWWHVIAGEVLSGGLVPASTHFLRTGASYHLVTRRSAAARPAVRKVRDWLVAEFAGLEASREALGLIAVHCDLSLPVTSE